jgi:hypothetical protein
MKIDKNTIYMANMANRGRFNSEIFRDGQKALSQFFSNVFSIIFKFFIKTIGPKETFAMPIISIPL